MKRYTLILIAGAVAAVLIVGGFFAAKGTGEKGERRETVKTGMEKKEEAAAPEAAEAELTQIYTSKKYRFSFMYPEGYAVRETKADDGDTITVENGANGFQIYITPFDETGDITEARIRKDIPDMAIKDAQPVELGNRGKGLAFMSDNEAWNGNSREVWFAFNGHLYQISTYARLDGFLQRVLNTWAFN